MKKIISIILTSLISCSIFAGEIKAYMLQNNGYLFEEKDNQMKYTKNYDSLPEGTEIQVITVKDENGKEVPEQKKSKREVSKKLQNCTCYHIKYNKKEYWVLTDRISFYKKVGVIINNCAVYRSPDIGNINETQNLTVGQIITYESKYLANGKYDFIKIEYYSPKDYTVYEGYVKSANISYSSDDLKAIKIINSIKETKDNDIKKEYLTNIEKLNISASILQYSKELTAEPKAEENTTSPDNKTNNSNISDDTALLREISFEDVSLIASIDCSKETYNLRDFPSTKNTNVINQLKADEENTIFNVNVTMMSSNEDTIDGITSNWYYIICQEKPSCQGWIFGGFISGFMDMDM